MKRICNKRKRNGQGCWKKLPASSGPPKPSRVPLPRPEDALVLELMTRVRKLEDEIRHLKQRAHHV